MCSDENRAEARFKSRRRTDRLQFQGPVQISLPSENNSADENAASITAWAYNLSPAGIGFVAPRQLRQQSVVIGLKLADGRLKRMLGRVVRMRQIPEEEFFDYGVVFEKTPSPQPAESQPAAASA